MSDPVFIRPDWPAPANVRAAFTTRIGGASGAPYESFNLGFDGGDEPAAVAENHRRLRGALELPAEPVWLRQVHGNRVIRLENPSPSLHMGNPPPPPPLEKERWHRAGASRPEADAAWTDRPGLVCAVLTADCLPVLLCERGGAGVAAVHCGWRGLAAGVLAEAIEALDREPVELLAWLGPAIGPEVYEVGAEVRDAFAGRHENVAPAFRPADRWNHFYCDLYAIARLELDAAGIEAVYGGGFCTYSDAGRFYSYRRDGVTGRMAALIWMTREGN